MIHLILGGARSGKSSFAESWCLSQYKQNEQSLIYIATATAFDNEMNERIEHHQQSRDEKWQLIECPLELAEQIKTASSEIYLVDCLTLWLNNLIYSLSKNNSRAEQEHKLKLKFTELTTALQSASEKGTTLVLVANEVGLGIIPMGEQTRLFVDYAGWLNQEIAKNANQVTLVTAGIPLTLKGDVNG